MANFSRVPELEISPDEADAVAEALGNIAAHYGLLSAGKNVWIELAAVLAPIVGGHYLAYRVRLLGATDENSQAQGHTAGLPRFQAAA